MERRKRFEPRGLVGSRLLLPAGANLTGPSQAIVDRIKGMNVRMELSSAFTLGRIRPLLDCGLCVDFVRITIVMGAAVQDYGSHRSLLRGCIQR
jgi:hypothetical protein